MIALPELVALNNRAARGELKIRDNFNRECSFVHSRDCFIVHSAVHRSTACISKADHPDSYFAAQYWFAQGATERDEFITQIVGGASLEGAEERAFRASRPEWKVILPKSKGTQGNRALTAILPGRLETRVGAHTWRHLHARTGNVK